MRPQEITPSLSTWAQGPLLALCVAFSVEDMYPVIKRSGNLSGSHAIPHCNAP